MPFDPMTLALLVLAEFVAGFVDSIAGGGGLIALPALLLTGLPPVQAVATNKLQSTLGTLWASYRYWKAGLVDFKALRPAILTTLAGAAAGGYALRWIDPHILERAIPVLLVIIALYFAFGPKASDQHSEARLGPLAFAFGAAAPIGFYDGMFGPGTGSFFAVSFVTLAGLPLLRATAHTKILNLMSNVASLAVFLWGGLVLIPTGLAMAVGQVLGAHLGSQTAINHGSKLIRPLIVVVCCAIAIRLLLNV